MFYINGQTGIMQSLDSQLQHLRNQIEGMHPGGKGGGALGPSHAYNKIQAPQVPHFRPAGGIPNGGGGHGGGGGSNTVLGSVYGASAVQELKPPVQTILEEEPKRKSYMWMALLVLVLIALAGAVAVYFIRRSAKRKQDMEELQLKTLAAELEEKQQEHERQQLEFAKEAAQAQEAEARKQEAERQMKQQVTASLLAQKPAPITSSRVTEMPSTPFITNTTTRATPVTPIRPENVPFPPFVPQPIAAKTAPNQTTPAQPTPPAQIAPTQIAPTQTAPTQPTPAQPTPTQSVPAATKSEPTLDTFQKGNAYLDHAIDNVSGSIRAGLQQAILTQQSFAAAEPQRDESILDNQGELGLRVSGKESFKVHSAVLDTVVSTHPTGEQPLVAPEIVEKPANTLAEV
jgi:hypothetical protein